MPFKVLALVSCTLMLAPFPVLETFWDASYLLYYSRPEQLDTSFPLNICPKRTLDLLDSGEQKKSQRKYY